MSKTGGILVVTREPETADAITAALGGDAPGGASLLGNGESMERFSDHGAIGMCRDLAGLHAHMEHLPDKFGLVIVDIDPDPAGVLGQLDQVINQYPTTRFVLVSHEVRQEWLLQAMQAGARHYMMKERVADELAGVVDRILPAANGHVQRSQSAVITLLGSAGGCGMTTLAVNLANELRLASSAPAVVLDLDCFYGSAAAHLGLEGSYGLNEVLRDGRPIDAELIRSTVVHHSDDPAALDVLMNPAAMHPGEPAHLDFTHLEKLLRACRRVYRWVIVDAPRLPLEVMSSLSQSSLATLLVFQMNVNDLRVAKATLAGLLRYGISSNAIVPIASRHRKRYGMLSLQDIQRALGHQRIGAISNDFSSAQTAVNYGQPLAQCAPRSTLRRDIRSLASSLVEAQARNTHVREW